MDGGIPYGGFRKNKNGRGERPSNPRPASAGPARRGPALPPVDRGVTDWAPVKERTSLWAPTEAKLCAHDRRGPATARPVEKGDEWDGRQGTDLLTRPHLLHRVPLGGPGTSRECPVVGVR